VTFGCECCHVEWSHSDGTECWLCFTPGVEWGDAMSPWNSQSSMSPYQALNSEEKQYERGEGPPLFLLAKPTDSESPI
jgi:hypothetical protein